MAMDWLHATPAGEIFFVYVITARDYVYMALTVQNVHLFFSTPWYYLLFPSIPLSPGIANPAVEHSPESPLTRQSKCWVNYSTCNSSNREDMVSLPASLFSAPCRPPTLSFPHLPARCGIVHLCDDADMQYWMDGPGHFVFKVL